MRRLGIHVGYAPSVTFKRDTGANPGKRETTYTPQEIERKFDAAGIDARLGRADTAAYEPAGSRHTELVQRIAAGINRDRPAAERYLLDAVAPRTAGGGGPRSRELAAVTNTAKRLFGHEVVFVKLSGSVLFNGAVSKTSPGFIFINRLTPTTQ